MTNLQAVFFDLGDTLVDLGEGRGDYEERLKARVGRVYDALAAAGAQLPDRTLFCDALANGSEERYRRALAEQQGLDIYDVLRWFFERMGIRPDDGLLEIGGDAYCRGVTAGLPLRTGALDLLRELRGRGLKLGVISNTLQPGRYLDDSLARKGLLEFFPARIYSSEVRVAKPHPAIFRAALAALDVPPERALHVGDRPEADVAGAHGVGMKAVLIGVPHRPSEESSAVPDARIAELPELLEVLDGLA